jgi:hypothetical protein
MRHPFHETRSSSTPPKSAIAFTTSGSSRCLQSITEVRRTPAGDSGRRPRDPLGALPAAQPSLEMAALRTRTPRRTGCFPAGVRHRDWASYRRRRRIVTRPIAHIPVVAVALNAAERVESALATATSGTSITHIRVRTAADIVTQGRWGEVLGWRHLGTMASEDLCGEDGHSFGRAWAPSQLRWL